MMFEAIKRMADQIDDIQGWLEPKNAHEAMPVPLAHV
jgi:hypothetical protein